MLRKVITPAAALLLSLGANAMTQGNYGQDYGQDCGQGQQCEEYNLEVPKAGCQNVTARKTKHQVSYNLLGGTTIQKKELIVMEFQVRQPLEDGNDLVQEWPVEKTPCFDVDQDQASQTCQKYKEGDTEATVLKRSRRTDFEGIKEGTVEVKHYTESELVFHGGDAKWEERPCGEISPEEFVENFTPGQASNFKINHLKNKLDNLWEEVRKGPVNLDCMLQQKW